MAAVNYGTLDFDEQIQFFRKKLDLPTESWTDIYKAEHDISFVAAGANRDDLVTAFREAVNAAIEHHETLEQFRKRFDEIVERFGWSYNGSRNWRSKVIYDTNLRTSYAAGRHEQLQKVKSERPYWEFHHTPVRFPRELHIEHPPAGWNGLILDADDPWWDAHYPPDGWGCQCVVYPRREADLKRVGKDGPDKAPPVEYVTKAIGVNGPHPRTVRVPKGIDPGFEYTPGKSRLKALTPEPLDTEPFRYHTGNANLPDLPNPVGKRPKLLPDGLSEQEYAQAFLDALGANGKRHIFFHDVLDTRLSLGYSLFMDGDGAWKIKKNGRHIHLLMLADALNNPDEIWIAWQSVKSGREVLRRRYIRVYGDGAPHGMAVFELDGNNWAETTIFTITDEIAQRLGYADALDYINSWRRGVRLYVRR